MKAKCRRPGNHLFGHGATGQGGALGVSGTGFAESDWEWFVYPIGHPPARHGRRAPNQYNLAAGNPSAIPIKRHDWGLDLSGSLRGAGGVGGLIRTCFSDVNYLPCYDGNGNVTELRLATTGAFAAQYQYDPFGREITSSGLVAPLNFYRFSTKPFDRETEFSYYGYRYYNAVLGRWLNRDPIGEAGGVID